MGKVFGGFTTVLWSITKADKPDDHAVLFSVDSMLKFPCLKKGEAVQHILTYGPVFKNWCLGFGSPMNTQGWSSFPGCGNEEYKGYFELTADSNGKSILTGEGYNFRS